MDAPRQNFSIDGKLKKEMIEGQIYLMASACDEHIDVQHNLSRMLNNYFEKNNRKCRARNDSQIYVDEHNFYEPDVKVLCRETKADDIPVIVVEVLSKSTQDRDYGIKMKEYAKLGIGEYWIADWKNCTVAIYLLSEGGSYEHHRTYALYIPEDKELRNLENPEKTKIEVTAEFSPVAFPDLAISLEKTFDVFK